MRKAARGREREGERGCVGFCINMYSLSGGGPFANADSASLTATFATLSLEKEGERERRCANAAQEAIRMKNEAEWM